MIIELKIDRTFPFGSLTGSRRGEGKNKNSTGEASRRARKGIKNSAGEESEDHPYPVSRAKSFFNFALAEFLFAGSDIDIFQISLIQFQTGRCGQISLRRL